MPMGMQMGGNKLNSPDDSGARPSDLMGGSSDKPTEGSNPSAPSEGEGSSPTDPGKQLTATIAKVHSIKTDLETIAKSFPAAAPDFRKAAEAMRKGLQQIAATGSGPGQETPTPRMLG